jgi:hypothetical protein
MRYEITSTATQYGCEKKPLIRSGATSPPEPKRRPMEFVNSDEKKRS